MERVMVDREELDLLRNLASAVFDIQMYREKHGDRNFYTDPAIPILRNSYLTNFAEYRKWKERQEPDGRDS